MIKDHAYRHDTTQNRQGQCNCGAHECEHAVTAYDKEGKLRLEIMSYLRVIGARVAFTESNDTMPTAELLNVLKTIEQTARYARKTATATAR